MQDRLAADPAQVEPFARDMLAEHSRPLGNARDLPVLGQTVGRSSLSIAETLGSTSSRIGTRRSVRRALLRLPARKPVPATASVSGGLPPQVGPPVLLTACASCNPTTPTAITRAASWFPPTSRTRSAAPRSSSRTLLVVLVDDGRGDDVFEIKGYRREDAKEKKATMETYWVPGVVMVPKSQTTAVGWAKARARAVLRRPNLWRAVPILASARSGRGTPRGSLS